MKVTNYIILIISIFLFFSCKEPVIKYPVVEIEPVKVDNISIYGEYVGLIRASQTVEISARVEGFLERITFNEGKEVKAGEPLFYINDKSFKANLERVQAQLKRDEAQEAKAKRDVERLLPLYQQNAVSQLDLDNAEAAYDMAKANVLMSKADLDQAKLELSYTVVRSPLNGYISQSYEDIGTLVGKSATSSLATVVKRDTVFVDFKMTALDYLRSQRRNVHLGELDSTRSWQPSVEVTLADNTIYGEKGIVRFASPQVDPKTGTFEVRAKIANPRQVLLPGQFTRVKLLLDVLENVKVVPRKAISIEKGGAFIFVIRPDSVAEKRFVEIGLEQNNKIIVTRGINVSEKIVVEGYQKLTHGQKVIPRTFDEERQILEEKNKQINSDKEK